MSASPDDGEWWRQEALKARVTGNDAGADLLAAVIAVVDGLRDENRQQREETRLLREEVRQLRQPASPSPIAIAAAAQELYKGASLHFGSLIKLVGGTQRLRFAAWAAAGAVALAAAIFTAGWLAHGQALVWAGSQACQGGTCYVPIYPAR